MIYMFISITVLRYMFIGREDLHMYFTPRSIIIYINHLYQSAHDEVEK